MITTILAIWGALLASVTFAWSIYKEVKRSGHLRVDCYVGDVFDIGIMSGGSQCLVWNITNFGKEPVILTYVGAITRNGHNLMLRAHIPLPKTLQPSEYVMEYSQDLKILDNDLVDLVARDSLGRIFKAPRRQVKNLVRQQLNPVPDVSRAS